MARTLNPTGLGELADVLTLPVGQVLAATRRAAQLYRRTSWELALLFVRIDAEQLYRPHRSVTGWGKAELGISSSQVSKHWQAGRALLAMPPERRPSMLAVGPTTAYESGLLRLAKQAPAKAAALAATSPSQRSLRRTVDRIAPKAKPAPPPALESIAAGPDGLRWALVVVHGTPPVYRLEVTGRERGDGSRAALERRQDLDAAGVVDELLRLADAVGVRGLLEARIRRRAA